jgi:hypothetical protein
MDVVLGEIAKTCPMAATMEPASISQKIAAKHEKSNVTLKGLRKVALHARSAYSMATQLGCQ